MDAQRPPKPKDAGSIPARATKFTVRGEAFRSLGYVDGEEWVAHCLELDILGFGDDLESALRSLSALVGAQLDFARDHGIDPTFSAPREILGAWDAIAEQR